MKINVLRLRTLAANCRRFAAIARNESARQFLFDLAQEYDARAADLEGFAQMEKMMARPRLLAV